MKKNPVKSGICLALFAAALYAINSPLSKLLLDYLPPTLMAGFLYIGAGMGMAAAAFIRKIGGTKKRGKPLFRRGNSFCNRYDSP